MDLEGLQRQSTERLAKCASLQLFGGSGNDNGNSGESLPALKAKFERLSQQFLALDKKKRFLELISSSEAVDLCDNKDSVNQLKQQAEDSKENLQSLHQEIRRMQEDCNNFYGALVSGKLK